MITPCATPTALTFSTPPRPSSPAQPSFTFPPSPSPLPSTFTYTSFPHSHSLSHDFPSQSPHQLLLPSAPLFLRKDSAATTSSGRTPSPTPASCDMKRSPGMRNLNLFTKGCFLEDQEAECKSGLWVPRITSTSIEDSSSSSSCSSPELPSSPESSSDDETCADSLFSIEDSCSNFSVSTTSSPTLFPRRIPLNGKITPTPSPTPSPIPSRRVRRRTLSYNPDDDSEYDGELFDVKNLVLSSPGSSFGWREREDWE